MSKPGLPEGEYARRREYLEPLFRYLRQHHYVPGQVARAAGRRHGLDINNQRLSQIKRAICVTPLWFVAECCAVVGRSGWGW
jgi:hypothetical protein